MARKENEEAKGLLVKKSKENWETSTSEELEEENAGPERQMQADGEILAARKLHKEKQRKSRKGEGNGCVPAEECSFRRNGASQKRNGHVKPLAFKSTAPVLRVVHVDSLHNGPTTSKIY